MRSIEVILSDTKVSIFGNKDFLDNPIISNWLEYSFEDFTKIDDGVLLNINHLKDKNFLYRLKFIKKKFSSYNIYIFKKFLHLVEDKIQESKNFEKFSSKQRCWKNIYDIKHFNEFCLSLEKTLFQGDFMNISLKHML